jgi:transposase
VTHWRKFKVVHYVLHKLRTGCQWEELPIEQDENGNPVMSWQVPRYHFYKWSRDGSLRRLFEAGILTIKGELNLSELNFDGSHTVAKKGGESVAYQGRKKAKTSNILPLIDGDGHIIGTTEIAAGNRNDAHEAEQKIKQLIKDMKRLELPYKGAFFNADSSFDSRGVRKLLWNRGLIPNIDENKRSRKHAKRGRKRHFNREVYKHRFTIERDFAWIDVFRTLLIRFERKDVYWLGFHFIAFTLINLRELLAKV